MKVWILTSEANDYNQHGEYFEAVFFSRPTVEQLMEQINRNWAITESRAKLLLEEGSGRRGTEDVWFNLEEHEGDEE